MRRALVGVVALSFIASPALGAGNAPAATPSAAATPAATPTAVAAANPVPAAALPPQHRAIAGDTISPTGALWRSALIPGWGQRYKGETKKGWVFTGIAGGLVASTVAAKLYADQTRHTYKSLKAGTDPSTFDHDYNASVQAAVGFEFLGGATLAFWGANVAESAFTPVEPIRIKEARVKDVFPAMAKFYETNPFATISVENRGSQPVSKLRVKFEAKDIMDLPAESDVVDTIPPGLGKSISLNAAFNKAVFDVGRSEPKEIQGKLTIEYEIGSKKHEQVHTAAFTVYGRNAIVWDDMRKLASFVTPREDGVKTFAATVLTNSKQVSTVKSINNAAVLFDALTAYGLTYVSDPSAPFSYFEGNAEAVDTVNFPFETLRNKTGDCDDLTSLYASLLESAGIPTALVDVPGHVFVMFDSGLSPDEMHDYVGTDTGYLAKNGSAWIPVEITALGKPFNQAWQLGSGELKKWSGLNQFNAVETEPAQSLFPPAPPDFGATPDGFRHLDGSKFASLSGDDSNKLGKTEANAQAKAVADIKNRHLPPASEANEIGIIYAKAGKYDDAVKYFEDAKAADPHMAKAYNNLANIAYMRGDLPGAVKQYQQALEAAGENAAILANLANIYFEQGDAKNARLYFARAVKIEPVYEREYPEIAALLRPAGTDASGGSVATNEGKTNGVNKAASIGTGPDPRKAKWIP